jgi:ABC-type polysaccharide/polyol phosphate transport system ATPase subunit
MALVRFKNVTVDYPIFTSHTRSIKTALFSRLGGKLASHNNTVIVRALDDINVELNSGDRLALIGHNGAGKTTFLRVASRIYEPQSGSVEIQGKVSSFTDLTLGMDLEATGWENITFRCVFMGLTFAEARELAPAIAEFSELGDYLDMPVRTYSTGMFLRLAFAISTSVHHDIIVMDELIHTGDASFIEKSQKRLHEIIGSASIFLLASHLVGMITSLCNKALWLEHGRIKALGPAAEVIAAYQASVAAGRTPDPGPTAS